MKLVLNNFVENENAFRKKYSFQGMACIWKDSLAKPCRGEKVEAKKEDNKEATKINLYAIAWTFKRKNKLVPGIGHIPSISQHLS